MNKNVPRLVFIEGQGNERLVRDTFSMGVVNTNTMAYNAAKKRHEEAMKKVSQEAEEKVIVRNEIDSLKNDVAFIKEALALILEKVSKKGE